MSDRITDELTRLAGLADDVAERAPAPSFDRVVERARQRRRRSRLALAAGGAVVAVAVGVGVSVGHDPAPAPGPAVADDQLPRAVSDLVASPESHVFEMVGGADGSLAVVWRDLVHPAPTFALVVRDAGGEVSGRVLDEPLDLTAAPGGWVATRSAADVWWLTADGALSELPVDDARLAPAAGDVLVPAYGETALLYRPSTGRVARPRVGVGLPELVTGSGGLVVYEPGPARVGLDGGPSVALPADTAGVLAAGSGDHLAVAAYGDDPDGSIPLVGLGVSHEAGTSWTSAVGGGDAVSSMVVLDDGTVLVTDSSGHVSVLQPGGTRLAAAGARAVRGLTRAGDRVYGFDATDDRGPMLWSDDAGATWHEDRLPGR